MTRSNLDLELARINKISYHLGQCLLELLSRFSIPTTANKILGVSFILFLILLRLRIENERKIRVFARWSGSLSRSSLSCARADTSDHSEKWLIRLSSHSPGFASCSQYYEFIPITSRTTSSLLAFLFKYACPLIASPFTSYFITLNSWLFIILSIWKQKLKNEKWEINKLSIRIKEKNLKPLWWKE